MKPRVLDYRANQPTYWTRRRVTILIVAVIIATALLVIVPKLIAR